MITLTNPSIEALNISKHFNSFVVVSDLNLRIEGSKCVGFLGPNGAGKTTTLKMFTDPIRPPIRRSSVHIGKLLAAFFASTVILGVFTAITVSNGMYYFGLNVPYQVGESVLFAWFYLAAVLGFTFFFSSLFKSSSMSILVTAILFLFAFTLIQTLVANLAQIEPWFILTYGA